MVITFRVCARVQEDNDGDVNSEVTTILQASRSSNAFDKITKFIDENIRAFRVSINV